MNRNMGRGEVKGQGGGESAIFFSGFISGSSQDIGYLFSEPIDDVALFLLVVCWLCVGCPQRLVKDGKRRRKDVPNECH